MRRGKGVYNARGKTKMESIIRYMEQDYAAIRSILQSFKEKYPFITLNSIGKSVYGREIPSIRIGRTNEYVLYAGAFHGTERITATLLLMFAEELCEALKNHSEISGIDAVKAMYGRGIIIVPMVNPDGCEIALKGPSSCGCFAGRIQRLCNGKYTEWNANLRGVDINHNFDADWTALRELERHNGIFGPAPRQFGGNKPHSEPETMALVDLCRFMRIRHAVAFHSQGEVIYWNFGKNTPLKARRMAEIMAASSGYALDVPTGLASGGGFKDWFIEKQKRPAFTVEVGRGKNPLDPALLPALYNRLREMLMITLLM